MGDHSHLKKWEPYDWIKKGVASMPQPLNPSKVTIQQAIAQGIKDKLTPVAQQQGEQTVLEIIATVVNDTVNKVNPSVNV